MDDFNTQVNNLINNEFFPGIEWKINTKDNVYQERSGFMNIKNKKPIQENTLYRIWSMTKPIVSVAIMQLIEKNEIRLEDTLNKETKYDNLETGDLILFSGNDCNITSV